MKKTKNFGVNALLSIIKTGSFFGAYGYISNTGANLKALGIMYKALVCFLVDILQKLAIGDMMTKFADMVDKYVMMFINNFDYQQLGMLFAASIIASTVMYLLKAIIRIVSKIRFAVYEKERAKKELKERELKAAIADNNFISIESAVS